ncbi:hypothetical protein TVAG_343510 [Trichomonas vaginalis G3]|uniref:Uncharacterized protein n=1 Tax=Trichomonas vaginalis (strain ATCC PRA-98 / G3) TaxID=412133 RepID=A2E1F5_TRIV3|nr:hypothetical protein TVAGG3_0319940 [Trichomonas vaginalis G3]EAY13522.1 hypothetical protein TVAG_343510 [Trichomonas vaginalis G3]KAI5529213.1 hypothetical protein TVAGG3_0319940 [Trichomonas vaginalis G3]|eukprot:XP_001325745.1 hypothetical protein [Trichomonas vaginalis G3]
MLYQILLNRLSELENARKFDWTEFYNSTVKVEKTQIRSAFSDTTSSNSYYIFICFFKGCKDNGAIYIKRSHNICTLLEDSIFNNCSSTSNGGSVFYDCREGGQFVQQRTCCCKSIALDSIAFMQWIKPSFSSKNYAFDISVSNCGVNETFGKKTFGFTWGELLVSRINSTFNKCNQMSSIKNTLSGSSGTCNFSTFRENNQTGTISLGFNWYRGLTQYIETISYCNVIGNKCGTGSYQVLFLSDYTTNVDNCIFVNNTAKYMFSEYYGFHNLTISDSYVESTPELNGCGTVTFTNLKQNYNFNEFSQLFTDKCFIDPKEISNNLSYLSKYAKTYLQEYIFIKK